VLRVTEARDCPRVRRRWASFAAGNATSRPDDHATPVGENRYGGRIPACRAFALDGGIVVRSLTHCQWGSVLNFEVILDHRFEHFEDFETYKRPIGTQVYDSGRGPIDVPASRGP
jgi:hypothetical protein